MRRLFVVLSAAFTALIMMLVGAGLSCANTSTYYWQGTGRTVHAAPSDLGPDGGKKVNMSTDRGWKAEFAPAFGQQTMDQSVERGSNAKIVDEVASDLNAGNTVTLRGFSLGALAADRVARKLSQRGVNTANLRVNVVADGYTPGTGALVVLRPYTSLLRQYGVTPAAPASRAGGQWTYECIQFDGVCDMVKNPAADPMGAVTRVLGYVMYHGAAGVRTDPVYNYRNRHNLRSTTTYVNGRKVIKYHAPNPVDRLLHGAAARPAATPAPVRRHTVAAPAAAPVNGDTPVSTYRAPAPTYVAPPQVQQPVQQTWKQAAPVVKQYAPQAEKPIRDFARQFGIRLP